MGNKAKAPTTRLKVRIPLVFEAEGEGAAPVVCVVVLCALFAGLVLALAAAS